MISTNSTNQDIQDYMTELIRRRRNGKISPSEFTSQYSDAVDALVQRKIFHKKNSPEREAYDRAMKGIF